MGTISRNRPFPLSFPQRKTPTVKAPGSIRPIPCAISKGIEFPNCQFVLRSVQKRGNAWWSREEVGDSGSTGDAITETLRPELQLRLQCPAFSIFGSGSARHPSPLRPLFYQNGATVARGVSSTLDLKPDEKGFRMDLNNINDHDKRPRTPTPVSPIPTQRSEPHPRPGSGAPPFMLPEYSRRTGRPRGTYSPY